MQTQTPTPGNVYSMNYTTGRLEPISAAGLLPVGAVVTYSDRANPRRRFAVTGPDLGKYGHGQTCICEDGHRADVSRSAINGPGGWEDTGEILDAAGLAVFLTAATTEGARLQAERAAAELVRTQDRATRRAAALRDFAHLERVPAGQYASAAHGAKNLRAELKRAFPGIKFSVRSETFSGGDSIDINWQLGPTTAEVKRITSKYQEGHFNGMEDIYETNQDDIWTDLFGGAKYVSPSRSEGGAVNLIAAALCQEWSLPQPADGVSFWSIRRADDHSGQDVGNIARGILFSQSYPAGAVVTGLERCDTERTDLPADAGVSPWARFYRVTYTTPAAPAPVSAPAGDTAPAAGISARYNAEKNGLELRFPSKPAEAVLAMLKRHGWRWSRFSGCWYQRASNAAVNAAAQAAGLSDDQRAELALQMNEAAHTAGVRGMEEACGIA